MKHFIFISMLLLTANAQGQSKDLETLISNFERGKKLSMAYIEAMPGDYFDYRPAEGSRSFAEQWLHLSQGMIGLSSNGSGLTKIFPGENLEKTPAYHSKAEVLRIVAESYDFAISGIRQMNPETLDEIVERGPFKVSRIEWIRKAKEHNDHHRGQTAVYLRLKGITPPQYQLF